MFRRFRKPDHPEPSQPFVMATYEGRGSRVSVYCAAPATGVWVLRVEHGDRVAEFPFGGSERNAENAAEAGRAARWLAQQNLRGCLKPGVGRRDFFAAVVHRNPRSTAPAPAPAAGTYGVVQVPGLDPDVIETVLEAHYRQMLASVEGRKVRRKLLADAATIEKAEKIRAAARS